MELLVIAFAFGPLLWIVLAILFVFRQATSSKLSLGYFVALCGAQVMIIAMPFVIFELSANAAGLSDFEGCPNGQEYCDDFYKLEVLQSRQLGHLAIASWIGSALWYSVMLVSSRLRSEKLLKVR